MATNSSQGDHDAPGSDPPTGPSQSAAVGPPNQGNYFHQMQQNTYPQAGGEAAAPKEPEEMNVDGDAPPPAHTDQQVPTAGSSSAVVDPAVTQACDRSDTPRSFTKSEDITENVITEQPSKISSASHTSQQHFGLSSGDNPPPGLTTNTMEQTPGAQEQYDGAKGFMSQQSSFDQDSQDMDETKPSEDLMQKSLPQDAAAVLVQIECKLKKLTQKWQNSLQKALQTFCSKLPGNVEICHLRILDTISEPLSAKVIVNSSAACEILLTQRSVTLKLKDINEEATVLFKTEVRVDEPSPEAALDERYANSVQNTQEIPMKLSVVVDLKKYDPHLANELLRKFRQHSTKDDVLIVNGTFEEVDEFYKKFRQVVGHPITSNTHTVSEHTNPDQMETSGETSAETLRVPLYQYWYLNHMHRKEIESIQEKHGVTIKADVCVSVEGTTGASSKSVTNASKEFHDLFLECAADIVSVSVPSVVDLVKEIQSLDDKLMLNTSAQNWKLIGLRNTVAAAQRELKLLDYKEDTRPKISESGRQDTAENMSLRKRWDVPKGIVMDIKDPHLSKGLHIQHDCCELMEKAFQKQIKDLENKFGVDFQKKKTDEDVTITAQTKGNQIVNLEMNALRALMSLYQKAFMTTMYCPLQNQSHNQTEMVKKHLSDIRERNSSLVVADGLQSGVWIMFGLPDHLRFAVGEIEKLFGPIFDEEHKNMMGYERGIEFLRPYVDGPAWEAAKGHEDMEVDHGAAGGERVDENIGEQGGAGWKTNRGFEGGAKGYGSSVDGPTSTDLYSHGGKAANAYEGQEQREAGSREGPNGNHKTLTGGEDGSGPSQDETCPICMDEFTDKEKLSCGHGFCKDCLRQAVESMGATCPVCKKVFGKIVGDQPYGTMTHNCQSLSLPGFKRYGSIVINYNIPSGTQSDKHPKPGRPFQGAQRTAYLPDNREGREVLALLKRAFDQRLIFTVGTSRTSGMDDCVTWNDVHHKTNVHGGAQNFGYPDDDYLKRVRDELKAKGVE